MFKKLVFLAIFCYNATLVAQEKDSTSIKNGIDKPSILATHHFGIFSSRINTNFKIRPPGSSLFSIDYTSGNNFHPFVEAYFTKDPAERERLSKLIWYERNFNFIDQETTPADYMNIVIDAVIKEFRFNFNIPLGKQHELGLTLRSYLITKGKYPFSLFTSDESIEWFHSNAAGGEDPYGRRYYGLNQVNFRYNDRNGNTLELQNNDFFFGGFEFNYFYYPDLSLNTNKNIFINFGSHLGVNTSKFNPSLDFGLSTNAIKEFFLNEKYELNIGIGANILRKNLINFGNVIDLGTNKYLATLETDIEITKYTKKRNYNSFSINYQIQSRYNKKAEDDYFRLLGKWQEINGGWQNGVATLYHAQSNWSFIYTYGNPYFKLSLYAKEDFLVNNAPDFQTGIGLTIPLSK